MINTRVSAGFNKINRLCKCCTSTEIKLSMAKNESESCVISIASDEKLENVSLELTKSNEGFTVEIEKEYFINCNGVKWPDPLAPVDKFDVDTDEITNLLVRFTTNQNTEAGKYCFTLALKAADGSVLCEYKVKVKVWNFALPEKYVINSGVGLGRGDIAAMHKIDDPDEKQRLYEAYYEMLVKFRLSPYTLPYDVLDDRADKYMSDPRVTSFMLNSGADNETLKKIHDKLSKNPEWMKKAAFYPVDEPCELEKIGHLLAACARLKRHCPGVRCISPFFTDVMFNETTDEVQILLDNLEIMCPKITCFNDDFIYRIEGQKEKFGSFGDRMEKAKEKGMEIWQYVCWEPGKPYVNMYVDESGLDHRILFWQQHMVGATGFLYWHTNYWKLIEDTTPWDNMATVPNLSPNVFGDGSLLYNGNKVGIDGPCASVRMETIRDGLEDCEMFYMADKVLGREWVLSKIKAVTYDLKTYTESGELFTAVRNEIGNELEKALNK